MRYDQWKTISAELIRSVTGLLKRISISVFYQQQHNSAEIQSLPGLMPSEIAETMPEFWINDDEEEGKNNFEEELFKNQLKRKGLKLQMVI